MKLLYSFLCIALAISGSSVCAKVTEAELAMNRAKGLRLISLKSGTDPVWKTEAERYELISSRTRFLDVTEVFDPNAPLVELNKTTNLVQYPPPSHQAQVKPLLGKLSLDNMKETVNTLAAFHDRYVTTPGGAAAADWVLKTVQDIIAKNPRSRATVKAFPHSWPQHSTIARIPGRTDGPVTIISSHVDTINLDYAKQYDRAPGADDDASAVAELIEAFRVLVESGYEPKTPVEFQWVSGEELGSIGSQAVAKSYKAAGVEVKGMMNIVLAGYVKPGTEPVFAILPDHVDEGLSAFLAQIIETYTDIPHVVSNEASISSPRSSLISSHLSSSVVIRALTTLAGYPVCFPLEGRLSDADPYRHSAEDTVDVPGFSWDHIFQFSKLILSFAYEMGA
ncbi:hypothetical protein DXG01_008404 [Tephrocybe rancida]|nr:hypothetical protein DXG01_008404 [Tephrocybe rancida]